MTSGYLRRMFTSTRLVAVLLGALSVSVSLAQDKPTCELVVPVAVSLSAEPTTGATCPCTVSAFEAKVFNRWGVEIFKTEKMEAFPQGIRGVERIADGTYMWSAKYTATASGEGVELQQTGYITVLK